MKSYFGSPHWVSDEEIARVIGGSRVDSGTARDLADEVAAMRRARLAMIERTRDAAQMLRDLGDERGRAVLLDTLCHIATHEEVYGCPPTDTPPSAESGDPPPRARSSG